MRAARAPAFLLGVLVITLVTPMLSLTPAVAATTRSPGLSAWKACGKHLQCAVLDVPVDYSRPDGDQIGMGVIRRPADDRHHRLGSLIVNFGGPGDAGVSSLPDFVGSVPPQIRARYDLVSFDPRGTGTSRPVECIDNAAADALANVDPTPNSDAQLRSFYDGTHEPVDLVAACVARAGAWLAHVGTRNVARDLDRLRAALGDTRVNFIGLSYGTVIGAVYAQMFPSRVGRVVLDGPVNLSASELDDLRQSGAAFEHALDAFLADCVRHTSCAFHNRGHTRAALLALQQRFERGLTIPTRSAGAKATSASHNIRRAGVAAFYTALISALYDKQYGWPTLADALRGAQDGNGAGLLYLADSYNGRHNDGTYDNIDQVIGVILCDDRFDPRPTYDQFVAEYHRDVAAYPILGGFVGSTVLGCDPRLPEPPQSEQLGDVHVTGTRPILVVGTTNDPATPYSGAKDLVGRIAGSRLLTFVSTEHTAYTKNGCIDRAVDAYLLSGMMPRANTRC